MTQNVSKYAEPGAHSWSPSASYSGLHPYSGCIPALATMHKKERAFAPPFRRLLGLPLITCDAIDTDALGTFTGEIARQGSMKDVAGHKARLASGITGRRLGLGSEGSFGPHPYIPFAAVDQEMVALYDRELGITIYESVVSLRTNFLHLDIDKSSDLDAFLRCVGFPEHGIVIGIADESAPWKKGVQTRHELDIAIAQLIKRADGRAIRVTTDMRAHVNPTRMRVIRAAATRLVRRIKTLCPSCGAPGFGIVDVTRGAPCSACGEPTEKIAATLLGCACCRRRELQPVRSGGPVEPKYCLACNP